MDEDDEHMTTNISVRYLMVVMLISHIAYEQPPVLHWANEFIYQWRALMLRGYVKLLM